MTTQMEIRRAVEDERRKALAEFKEIGQICALANKSHMAMDYFERGSTPAQVRAELLDGRPMAMAQVDLAADMRRRHGIN
jgi:hypothetical protein